MTTNKLYPVGMTEAERQQHSQQLLSDTVHELTSLLSGIRLLAGQLPSAARAPADLDMLSKIIDQTAITALSLLEGVAIQPVAHPMVSNSTLPRLSLPALLVRQATFLAAMLRVDEALIFKTEWAADLPQYIAIDEGRLQQVLLNWVNNVLQHSRANQLLFKVTRADQCDLGKLIAGDADMLERISRCPHNGLVFSIQDNGIGIAMARQLEIFERSVSTASGDAKGLGLAIVLRLAAQMRAAVALQADCQPGCKFSLLVEHFV